jgi:exonuclease VII small subunit
MSQFTNLNFAQLKDKLDTILLAIESGDLELESLNGSYKQATLIIAELELRLGKEQNKITKLTKKTD